MDNVIKVMLIKLILKDDNFTINLVSYPYESYRDKLISKTIARNPVGYNLVILLIFQYKYYKENTNKVYLDHILLQKFFHWKSQNIEFQNIISLYKGHILIGEVIHIFDVKSVWLAC